MTTLGLEFFAGLVLLVGWLGFDVIQKWITAEDLTAKVSEARLRWLNEMLGRADRITDISLARGLMQSVTFLASTSVLLITGAIGLIGSAGFMVDIINESIWLSDTTRATFEIKTGVLLLIFVQTFFRLTWALRLHSYSMILIGAAPSPEDKHKSSAKRIAQKAAGLSALASRHYLAGLRGYYFGWAALAWYVHPLLLVGAIAFTYVVLIRREYFSHATLMLDGLGSDGRMG